MLKIQCLHDYYMKSLNLLYTKHQCHLTGYLHNSLDYECSVTKTWSSTLATDCSVPVAAQITKAKSKIELWLASTAFHVKKKKKFSSTEAKQFKANRNIYIRQQPRFEGFEIKKKIKKWKINLHISQWFLGSGHEKKKVHFFCLQCVLGRGGWVSYSTSFIQMQIK